jgi:hypothetical protein
MNWKNNKINITNKGDDLQMNNTTSKTQASKTQVSNSTNSNQATNSNQQTNTNQASNSTNSTNSTNVKEVDLRLDPSKRILDKELEEKIQRQIKKGNKNATLEYKGRRYWTETELDYLQEKWGIMSVPNLAKNLNRSVESVIYKVRRLELGGLIQSSSYISLFTLFCQFGKKHSYRATLNKWINHNFQYRNQTVNNKSVKVVHLDYFWEWAEQNKHIINFSKLEPNSLGLEPDWVKDKRRADVKLYAKKCLTKWTKGDDSKLETYLKLNKYDKSELARLLNRTENAILRRITKLKLEYCPVKAKKKQQLWTKQEILKLVDLHDKGYSNNIIVDLFENSRSEKSIEYKLHNLKLINEDGNGEYKCEYDMYLKELRK